MLHFAANISILFAEFDFPDRFAAAASNGFDAVELWFPYAFPPDSLRPRLDDHGLELISLNTSPGDLDAGEFGLAGVPGREDDFKRHFTQAMTYADALDSRFIHVLAGNVVDPAIRAGEALDVYRANLAWALEQVVADTDGPTLLIEGINGRDRPQYVNTRSDLAADIVAAFNHPRLGMIFDTYHVARGEGDVLRRMAEHWPHIRHIQVAGVPERQEPDRGELDYRAVFREIAARGWTQHIGAEYAAESEDTAAGLGWRETLLAGIESAPTRG